MKIQRNPEEISIRPDGKIIRRDEDRCGQGHAVGLSIAELDRDQASEERREIAPEDLVQGGLFPFMRIERRDELCKLGSGQGVKWSRRYLPGQISDPKGAGDRPDSGGILHSQDGEDGKENISPKRGAPAGRSAWQHRRQV